MYALMCNVIHMSYTFVNINVNNKRITSCEYLYQLDVFAYSTGQFSHKLRVSEPVVNHNRRSKVIIINSCKLSLLLVHCVHKLKSTIMWWLFILNWLTTGNVFIYLNSILSILAFTRAYCSFKSQKLQRYFSVETIRNNNKPYM